MTHAEATEILRLTKLADASNMIYTPALKYLEAGDLEGFESVYRAEHEWLSDNDIPYVLTDGVARKFYVNGQLACEATCKAGKFEGVVRWFHFGGWLDSEMAYKDGKLDGISRRFNRNGEVVCEITYKNGHPLTADRGLLK